MSDIDKARRADTQVVFNGVDISVRVNKDLRSLTYTDNEEDETDDLQIKVLDRENKWLTEWLGKLTDSAATGGEIISSAPEMSGTSTNGSGGKSGGSSSGSGSGTGESTYKVTATTGVNVRSNTTSKGKTLGKLPYGTVVTVHSISGEYAKIDYSGKTGYIKAANLKPLGTTGGKSVSSSGKSSGYKNAPAAYSDNGGGVYSADWKIGDEVTATGNPQYSSWGTGGMPGQMVINWKGKVSNLNLQPGIPYPICVDYLGWFAENQVQKVNLEEQKPKEKPVGKGLTISAAITRRNFRDDGKDDILDCGVFELDNITADNSPNGITIRATSVPYSCSIRQTLKSKSWENTSLQKIVKEIADKNGFGVMYEVTANPMYSRVEQYRQSDIAFLSKLCHDCGASLKFTNNIIVVFDQAKYENKKAVRTIKYGKEYEKYRLSTGTNNTYTSCRVSYTTPSGTVISAVEYAEGYKENSDKNQCLEVHQKVGSIAEAQELAHKTLRLHNKYEYEASFTFPGDTSLVAGCTVELSGFGAWNGKYIIKQAKHSISHNNGYTTQITLRKALPQQPKSITVVKSDSDAEIDALARQCINGDWGNAPERFTKLDEAGHDSGKVQDRVNEILYK